MRRYVAFLLGINVGKRKVSMIDLQQFLTHQGYQSVRTVLATGNVIFETEEKNESTVEEKLGEELSKEWGFKIQVIIRPFKYIADIVIENPFSGIDVTSQTKLYVTFLTHNSPQATAVLSSIPTDNFRIISITASEVFSVITLTESYKTTDAMNVLNKKLGKEITTRNWNTLRKIAAL